MTTSSSPSSYRNPPWRVSHSPKKSVPASLSFVLAQPEHSPPPARAAVYAQQRTNGDLSTSSRRPTPRPSLASIRVGRPPAQEVHETGGSTPLRVRNSESQSRASYSPYTASPTTATTTLNAAAPSPSTVATPAEPSLASLSALPPAQKSWFSSLNRAKGSKMGASESSQDSQPPRTLAPRSPVVDLTQDRTPIPLPSIHSISGDAAIASRKMPSSPPPSITQAECPSSSSPATAIPILIAPASTSSNPLPARNSEPTHPPPAPDAHDSPSSIDEEVPIVNLSAELLPPSISIPSSADVKLGTLNTSSSRFTLGIPFLGRAKVSSETALGTKGKAHIIDGLPEGQRAEGEELESSLPQPLTTNLITDAAEDSLSNAMVHVSELPSKTAVEMEISKGAESSPASPFPRTAAETTPSDIQTQPSNASWWSYLGWSSASTPSSPEASSSSKYITSMSAPPSKLGLRQFDSSPDTVATSPNLPLASAPAATIENDDSPASSTTVVAPSKASAASQNVLNHANEVQQGSSTPSGPANSGGNIVSNASEPEMSLPRSLPSQERNAGEAQQQLESAEQPGAAASSNAAPPPTSSWFSPWSWNSHSYPTVTMGHDDGGNKEGKDATNKTTANVDPAGKEGDEQQGGLQAVTYAERRAGMELAAESQAGDVCTEQGLDGREGIADIGAEAEVATSLNNNPPLTNPIEQSISTNRSGWASFFSSKKLVIKALSYSSSGEGIGGVKRDKNGMEIMELDFDESATTADSVQSLSLESKGKGTVQDRDSDDMQLQNGRDVKISVGAKTSQDGAEKQSVVPPLTNSEDLKREVLQSDPAKKGIPPTLKPASGSSTPISRASTPIGKGPVPPPSPATASAGDRRRTASPTPSSKKAAAPPPPNLVLPTWEDTFCVPPRSVIPPPLAASTHGEDQSVGGRLLGRTMKFVSGVLFSKDASGRTDADVALRKQNTGEGFTDDASISAAEKMRQERIQHFGKRLPRAWDIVGPDDGCAVTGGTGGGRRVAPLSSLKSLGQGSKHGPKPPAPLDRGKDEFGANKPVYDVLRGCRRVVVIGIHGWFPGTVVRTVLGEPTGTSGKFVNMMIQALEHFQQEHDVSLEKITRIPLEGEGTIERRVEKLYNNLTANKEWMDDLHSADAIFVATHSQGSVVSTHLLNQLIHDRHIRTAKNSQVLAPAASFPASSGMTVAPAPNPQRVCCLALCGIHLGPLRYLSSSSLFQPYIQYFESSAARELFEFQNTESAVSKSYVNALRQVLGNGVKMVYVASLNDQVVPIYSGLFTAVSHPLILRALYIDGDAYHSSDFLSNLLVLLLRILNSGISDSRLLAHLSEATAGSLNGVGHSTAYEELATYSLAVKYLFLTNDGHTDHTDLTLEPFNATQEQNDYEIPWALRDVIADEHVKHFFGSEITALRDAFRDWHPKTTILRDLKRKLQPIQRLPTTYSTQASTSKL